MKMTKNKNIPEGYMTVGQVAEKNGNHRQNTAVLRQRRPILS